MNYQLMINMKEYEPEFDQMLFNLPLQDQHLKKFITMLLWVEQFLSLYLQKIYT